MNVATPNVENHLKSDLLRRKSRSADGQIGCIHMATLPGDYWYSSQGGDDSGGLLAIVDGWELQGEMFPSQDDHPQGMDERYHAYCGPDKPNRIFIASQNVALIQFRIPSLGEGFKVNVRLIDNPQPCNAVAMLENGIYTMKNFGERRNCTISIIYPERIQLVSVDVGVTAEKPIIEGEIGLTDKCAHPAGSDLVEIMNGNGLDTSIMTKRAAFCGMESGAENKGVVLGCQHSVVRLVSSGKFYNSITFLYTPPTDEELVGGGC
ncbi:hypothetical protein ScPMuIL_002925 [Solemya velum]